MPNPPPFHRVCRSANWRAVYRLRYDRRMKHFLLASALLIGCGGGVSDSKKLSDLTAEEAKDACLEAAADFPERTVDCGDGIMLTVGVAEADCNTAGPADAGCTATVGDARACFDAMYSLSDAQICTAETLPAACAKLEGC